MSQLEPFRGGVWIFVGIMVLVVLVALCVAASSDPGSPIIGRWVIREYQIHGTAVMPEEIENVDGGAFTCWNSLSFTFSAQGDVRANFPDTEDGEVIMTYQFDGRYIELFHPDRKSRYRLLELAEDCLIFTPPYSHEMIIFLKKVEYFK